MGFPAERTLADMSRRWIQKQTTRAVTHEPFQTRSHHGRHHAPVWASTRSEIPNNRETAAAVIPRSLTDRGRPEAPIATTAAKPIQNPASIRFPVVSRLIHKAAGWMLREVGKRNQAALEGFLNDHARVMPRTMLRYAIERFPEETRRAFLRRESGR